MGDTARQIWGWISWHWAVEEFLLRVQSLNMNLKDKL